MKSYLKPLDWALIVVAVIGIVANAATAWLLHQDSHWLPICSLIGSIGLFACALIMLRAAFIRSGKTAGDASADLSKS
ncbi:hypothetical protein [Schaalia vaccimaxillae]|uniref:hypothetical protein n=1 Tax=Schaalia vaccimaxillae TaxID=183916 RepID=UPI0003B59FB5|nr:hypothetical protein [Schaalia vaccimaxillae]